MIQGKSTKIITKSIPFCQAFALVLLARFLLEKSGLEKAILIEK